MFLIFFDFFKEKYTAPNVAKARLYKTMWWLQFIHHSPDHLYWQILSITFGETIFPPQSVPLLPKILQRR